jgi:hypothetical protein
MRVSFPAVLACRKWKSGDEGSELAADGTLNGECGNCGTTGSWHEDEKGGSCYEKSIEMEMPGSIYI